MGALRKTLVYLGLAEDSYDDEADGDHDDVDQTNRGARSGEQPVDHRPSGRQTTDRHVGDRQAADRQAADRQPSDRNSHDRQPAAADRPVGRGMDRLMDTRPGERRATVTALPHIVGAQGPMQRITAVHPRSYNDAKVIGEHFRDGVPVIMNLTEMSDADAKRLVDFAAGLVFGLQGVVERVTTKVFLLSPATIEVTNEVQDAPVSPSGFFNQS